MMDRRRFLVTSGAAVAAASLPDVRLFAQPRSTRMTRLLCNRDEAQIESFSVYPPNLTERRF